MNIINEYAVSIIIVSLLAILLESLLPEGSSKKYSGVLIGLFVMLVMLNPLTKLPHYDRTFVIPETQADDIIVSPANHAYVAENFETNLALTIADDIRKTYGSEVHCRISCDLNESGQITGIRKLTLSPYSQDISRYISEKYDIEEARITS